jgi:hypothetical protein
MHHVEDFTVRWVLNFHSNIFSPGKVFKLEKGHICGIHSAKGITTSYLGIPWMYPWYKHTVLGMILKGASPRQRIRYD